MSRWPPENPPPATTQLYFADNHGSPLAWAAVALNAKVWIAGIFFAFAALPKGHVGSNYFFSRAYRQKQKMAEIVSNRGILNILVISPGPREGL
jgi:hypothetical protein